jgi:hypothetical protein
LRGSRFMNLSTGEGKCRASTAIPAENSTRNLIIPYTNVLLLNAFHSSVFHSSALSYRTMLRSMRLKPSPTNDKHKLSIVKPHLICRYSSQYSARLSAHPNDLIVNLVELPDNRRLRRHLPNDLLTRFLV